MEFKVSDRVFLMALHSEIWVHSRDRVGRTHSFPNRERPLGSSGLFRVLELVEQCELPCLMHSGPYGGLSISIYEHAEAPGAPPEMLIALDEDHFFDGKAPEWDERFDLMAVYTHNERNKELCALYGLPAPREKDSYRY